MKIPRFIPKTLFGWVVLIPPITICLLVGIPFAIMAGAAELDQQHGYFYANTMALVIWILGGIIGGVPFVGLYVAIAFIVKAIVEDYRAKSAKELESL